MDELLWSVPVTLAEVQRASRTMELQPDAGRRAAIAEALDLLALTRFDAVVAISPWLDGAELAAHWTAEVTQTCGVTVEPFETALKGEFIVRVVPPDSAAAPTEGDEVSIDPAADDPPDVLKGATFDVGAYLVEHLALEIDPFPRKPGATFEPPPEEQPASPFAVLRAFGQRSEGEE